VVSIRSVNEATYPRVGHVGMDGGCVAGSVEVLRQAANSIHRESQLDSGQSEALNGRLSGALAKS